MMNLSLCTFITSNALGAEKNCLPFLTDSVNQSHMIAPANTTQPKFKTYILPATPATTQWGVFNNSQKPVLTIEPGDTVVVETMAAADNQVVPGTEIKGIIRMNTAVSGRGPHTVTGPIYVQGAEPGDSLRIHFNKIVPRAYASNDSTPKKGLFPDLFPDGFVKYFYLDVKNKKMQFAPGIIVPLAPFPGVIAVARAEPGPYSSGPPGTFGGNMDLREMTEGTTLYLPVFVKGGLIWTGDSHAGQGNGEIDLTAIETAFQEFNMTVDLIKNQSLTWPRVETKSDWIAMGYDKNLNKAFDILTDETIKLIMNKRHVNHDQAEKIMHATWNCPIAEVVNGVQGVYCMVPKSGNKKTFILPKIDNTEFFVTSGKNTDLETAMKVASMDMLKKIVSNKKMTMKDAYMLASFAMDCRIATPDRNTREVICMMPKKLWV
jgi:acetamidase/formamidase